ncbi:hypothetical protein [Pseudomonas sp. C2B4]|uniref:hypothetical protein n=1 Tax=Pseudomonas sp. C2B4 TaxID=2735270 RepID=UPI003556C919
MDAFLNESSTQDLAVVLQELNELLDKRWEELELRTHLLKELSCYYCYWNEWETGESWLRHIAQKLADYLNNPS